MKKEVVQHGGAREGAGRPCDSEKPRNKSLVAMVTEDEKKMVENYSKGNNTSTSNLIRGLLIEKQIIINT